MDKEQIFTGIIVNEEITFSFIDICEKYHLNETILQEMAEHGLFELNDLIMQKNFDYKALQRIQSAARLHHDLGVNIPGSVLVLELLDELNSLRKELAILRHHVTLDPEDL